MSYYKTSATLFIGLHALIWSGYLLAEKGFFTEFMREYFEWAHHIILIGDVITGVMFSLLVWYALLSFLSKYFNKRRRKFIKK